MNRHFNFADLFELAADTVPDRVAVVDRRRRVTYAELEARANRLAHALQDAGVQARPARRHPRDELHRVGRGDGRRLQDPGERGERQLPLRRGGAALPPRQLRHGRARLPTRVRAADHRAPAPRSRSCRRSSASSGTAPTPTTPSSSRSSTRRRSPPHSPARDFGERSDDDVYLLYTGGTTGMPKGVMWRQEDVYFALAGGIDVFTIERDQHAGVGERQDRPPRSRRARS